MEKNWRLQRYSRKDYSELVEFPVEIVGRDGVVRRYTFEDSIRLYRRRISLAAIRYRDGDVQAAEVDHCRARIDQLRRSFFYRYGWGTPEGQPAPVEVFGDMAGELAAFIARVMRVDGRLEVRFEPLADPVDGVEPSDSGVQPAVAPDGGATGEVTAWYVVPKGADSGMLLYVYRFDGQDGDQVRERFFTGLKAFERMGRPGGDGERLIAFHHTVDCGFVLTGRGSEYQALGPVPSPDEETSELEPTPWEDALEAVRRGDHAGALGTVRQVLAEQPYHRNAYLAGAVLAFQLDQPWDAEELARLGWRYFPEDPELAYYTGAACVALDRHADAIPALEAAAQRVPRHASARLLLGVCYARTDRIAPLRALVRTRPDATDDRRLELLLERLGEWARVRRYVDALGGLAVALGLVAVAAGGWFGLVPALAGAALWAASRLAWRREVRWTAAAHRVEDLAVGLRRVRQRTDPARA